MKVLWGLRPAPFMLGSFAVAWAVGFGRYLGAGMVSFPVFPNVLDCLGLVLIGAYLLSQSRREPK